MEKGIERKLWHELGHACTTIKLGELNVNSSYYLGCLFTDYTDLLRSIPGFGDERARCVREKLSQAADTFKKTGTTACLGRWYFEAMADLFFYWNYTPEHFAFICDTEMDELHGPATATMECFYRFPPAEKAFCANRALAHPAPK
jgi:hypothetical protein